MSLASAFIIRSLFYCKLRFHSEFYLRSKFLLLIISYSSISSGIITSSQRSEWFQSCLYIRLYYKLLFHCRFDLIANSNFIIIHIPNLSSNPITSHVFSTDFAFIINPRLIWSHVSNINSVSSISSDSTMSHVSVMSSGLVTGQVLRINPLIMKSSPDSKSCFQYNFCLRRKFSPKYKS
jgi:hypothetical protein